MIVFIYISAVFLAYILIKLTKIINSFVFTLNFIIESIEILANHTMSDSIKADLTRLILFKIIRSIFHALTKLIIILLTLFLFIKLIGHYVDISINEVIIFSTRSDVLIYTTLYVILHMFIANKYFNNKKSHSKDVSSSYTALDRAIHNLSFGSITLQKMLIYLENKIFRGRVNEIEIKKPIFITSLPRAGTTILLESLSMLPNIATHTYRDMPFIFTPILWDKISRFFRNKSELKERAHGDGIKINEDSPEALEESIWYRLFKHKYQNGRISLWKNADDHFSLFFKDHIKKIILIRSINHKLSRYVSKNNANISRIPVIKTIFPDSKILIPLRDPIEHAISMYQQHKNFLDKHRNDHFSEKYMSDIGHFEFGLLHRPILFDGLYDLTYKLSPESLDYWIVYWISGFNYLKDQENVDFLSFEDLMNLGANGLEKLCHQLEVEASKNEIAAAASIFRKPPSKRQVNFSPDINLSQQALDLYNELHKRCILRDIKLDKETRINEEV